MTNTKFRRRALVSSLAMLLVALVALGSATFAWFTENPKVSATGIIGSAETSVGLQVWTTTEDDWKNTQANLFVGQSGLIIAPAYPSDTVSGSTHSITWLSANSTDANSSTPSGAWKAGPDATLVTKGTTDLSSSSRIYHEQVKVRPTSGSANISLTNLAINPPTAATGDAIKAGATVLVAMNGEIKAYAKVGDDGIKNYGSPAATETITAWTSTDGYLSNKFNSSTPVSLATGVVYDTPMVVDVYVFLDGTDEAVKTNNTYAADVISSVTLEFKKTN